MTNPNLIAIDLLLTLSREFKGLEQGVNWRVFNLKTVQDQIARVSVPAPIPIKVKQLRQLVARLNDGITHVDCYKHHFTTEEQVVIVRYQEILTQLRIEALQQLMTLDPAGVPTPWTSEELTDAFIKQVRGRAVEAARNNPNDAIGAADQTAFSILSLLDSGWMEAGNEVATDITHYPGMRLVAVSDPEDIEYAKQCGKRWADPDTELDWALHERYYRE